MAVVRKYLLALGLMPVTLIIGGRVAIFVTKIDYKHAYILYTYTHTHTHEVCFMQVYSIY